jgi:hypothetical protein
MAGVCHPFEGNINQRGEINGIDSKDVAGPDYSNMLGRRFKPFG